ncbi:MAG TPA: hypothetical protein PKV93_11135, partial [Fervidobacterium sp.]|nr:hypothetical protein [Fervidobacterium sp.]
MAVIGIDFYTVALEKVFPNGRTVFDLPYPEVECFGRLNDESTVCELPPPIEVGGFVVNTPIG